MAEANKGVPSSAETKELAIRAAGDEALLRQIVDALAGDDRRARQLSASVIHEIALHDPTVLKEFSAELADALHRPELQTRWEILGVFEKLVAVDARAVDKALAGAETALHDEESGVVRLAAFRLLCAYGATTERRSERVWPLIDEAIRCYHGDAEFQSMLTSVYRLVLGGASDEVKIAAAERMAFDAENGKGLLKRRARSIVECAPKNRPKK
ncbi:MAG: hypothetical protein HGA39_04800 [Coriobacteriia bacterium]|nr:hypothetical protein [Coriobacteriia bacterium]